MFSHRGTYAVAALLSAALLGGCGSSSSSSSSTTTTTATTTAPARASVTFKLPGNTETGQGTPATLKVLPKATPPGGLKPKLAGLQGLSVVQKLTTFGNDVSNFWVQGFKAAKVKLPPATVDILDQTTATCGSMSISTNTEPVYCGSDGAIYLPLAYFTNTIEPLGDAASLLEVSDLYGYHIENSLGFFTAAQQGKITPADLRKLDSCLSGVYFYSLGKRNLLTNGDARAVDKLIAAKSDAPGTPAGPGTVTFAQLQSAFLKGFKAASPGVCVK